MEVPTVVITCCNTDCGISFAVPQWWQHTKRQNHSRFYCPNGHGQSYASESDEEKLRRERDHARQQIARVEQEKAAAIAEKEREIKAIKRRAASGSCPCCKRTFSNMATHMRKQHPQFVTEVIQMPKKRRA